MKLDSTRGQVGASVDHMTERIQIITGLPTALKAQRALSAEVDPKAAMAAGVDRSSCRAGQDAGVAAQRVRVLPRHAHRGRALHTARTPRRLFLLDAWRETDLYTEQERAALELTEALTRLSETRDVPDDVYEYATKVFTESAVPGRGVADRRDQRLQPAGRPGASGAAERAGVTAAVLRALHVPGRPLVLPNAWDAASAKLVVEAGFPVVATSSGRGRRVARIRRQRGRPGIGDVRRGPPDHPRGVRRR